MSQHVGVGLEFNSDARLHVDRIKNTLAVFKFVFPRVPPHDLRGTELFVIQDIAVALADWHLHTMEVCHLKVVGVDHVYGWDTGHSSFFLSGKLLLFLVQKFFRVVVLSIEGQVPFGHSLVASEGLHSSVAASHGWVFDGHFDHCASDLQVGWRSTLAREHQGFLYLDKSAKLAVVVFHHELSPSSVLDERMSAGYRDVGDPDIGVVSSANFEVVALGHVDHVDNFDCLGSDRL